MKIVVFSGVKFRGKIEQNSGNFLLKKLAFLLNKFFLRNPRIHA